MQRVTKNIARQRSAPVVWLAHRVEQAITKGEPTIGINSKIAWGLVQSYDAKVEELAVERDLALAEVVSLKKEMAQLRMKFDAAPRPYNVDLCFTLSVWHEDVLAGRSPSAQLERAAARELHQLLGRVA
jgi:hypothetical protein